MESSKLQAVPRAAIGKQQATLFDECKAVLSRLGLYRHMAADDQHTDQFKAPSGGKDTNGKATLSAISPSVPHGLVHSMLEDGGSQSGQHDHSLAPDNHTTRDQHPQPLTPASTAPTPMAHTGSLRPGSPICYSTGGDSMASCISMGNWDALVHARATRSPRAPSSSSQGHGQTNTRPPDQQPTRPPAPSATHLPPDPAPAPAASTPALAMAGTNANRRPTRQVMMYVHATGEPIDRFKLEQHASAATQAHGMGMDAAGALGPTPVSTPLPMGMPASMMSGLKRHHSQSTQQAFMGEESPVVMPMSPTEDMIGLEPWKLLSPNQHMAMRRSNRPATVPELNFSALPHVDCDSPYGQKPRQHMPNLPESLCQDLDPEEEDRLELESWAAPARWLPSSEGRHYVFKPVNSAEIHRYQLLRSSLPSSLAMEVDRMWNSLIEARYACELMSSRGVRVVKDVTREWSEMSSHLIQRIEAHESAAADMQAYCHQQSLLVQQLTYQLKLAQASAAANMPSGSGGTSGWSGQHGGLDLTQDAMASVEMAMAHAARSAQMMRQPRRADRGGQVHSHMA